MECWVRFWYCFSLLFSAVFAVLVLSYFLLDLVKKGLIVCGKKEKAFGITYVPFRWKTLILSVILLFSVLCVRIAAGLYEVGGTGGSVIESVLDSAVHTFQTFSLDESYAGFVESGKQLTSVFAGCPVRPWFVTAEFGGIYIAVLNLLAPVVGGVFVLEAIVELSPKFRLLLVTIFSYPLFRKIYYFSKLNDNSLALAKDCVGIWKSVVFADCGDEEDTGSQLLSQAKAIGGICLKQDLLSISSLSLRRKRNLIFLIDESENDNLETLTYLISPGKGDAAKYKATIYVFSSDREYSDLDEKIAFILQRSLNGSGNSGAPLIIPVNGVRNIVTKLYDDVPLFEPVIGTKATENGADSQLNLTIVGSGSIGTEAFLNAYWCGQMLGCGLHITVISKEKRNAHSVFPGQGDFEGRIDSINPEIFETCNPSSPLLKYNDRESNPPYFSYDYIEADVTSGDLTSGVCCDAIRNTDYFIVAAGTDELNLSLADKIRIAVGREHLFGQSKRRTVISYAIYNSDLCAALNKDRCHRYRNQKDEACDVYMHAFGSLEEMYSRKNVRDVGWTGKGYSDIYSIQSSAARRMHRKYAEYSAGFHAESVFTATGDCFSEPADNYLLFVEDCRKTPPAPDSDQKRILNELAWLEHRRWNAYMRSRGFRNPNCLSKEGFERYFGEEGLTGHEEAGHKYITLKLHPCLVECDKQGMSAGFDALLECDDNDCLDALSLKRHILVSKGRKCDPKKVKFKDFKLYDFPEDGLNKEDEKKIRALIRKRSKKHVSV